MTQELSQREVEVVGLMADGLGNDEIAAILCLSTETVKAHVRRIAIKLEVAGRASTRTAIVAFALRRGFVS